jgi:hypothetical protein
MKNFLVELDESGQQKFWANVDTESDSDSISYKDETLELEESLRNEMEGQKLDSELRLKLIREIIDAFDRRDSVRKRLDDMSRLRDTNVPETDKINQLIVLQEKLRREQEEKRK